MLVFARNPQGCLKIGQYRIYGSEMVQGPTEVPFELYQASKESLEHATYREGHLRKLFGCGFPEIAFRYDELRYLPDSTLDVLGDRMGLSYDNDWPKKRKVEAVKTAIRNASPA